MKKNTIKKLAPDITSQKWGASYGTIMQIAHEIGYKFDYRHTAEIISETIKWLDRNGYVIIDFDYNEVKHGHGTKI